MAIPVHLAAGLLAGDPPGCPGAGGGLAVQGHGVFQHHIGPPSLDVVEEHPVEGVARPLEHAGVHPDAVGPQDVQPPARHQGVGVAGTHHHPCNPGLQDGIGAGGLPPLVAAGLQGDVEGGSGGGAGAVRQCLPLGVEPAASAVPSPADNRPVLHQDGPHHGVGGSPARTPLRQLQGHGHVVLVCFSRMPRLRKEKMP